MLICLYIRIAIDEKKNNMDSHTISHKSNGIITVLKTARKERIPLNMAKIKNILLKAGITLTSLFSIGGVIFVCVCYASEWFAEYWTMIILIMDGILFTGAVSALIMAHWIQCLHDNKLLITLGITSSIAILVVMMIMNPLYSLGWFGGTVIFASIIALFVLASYLIF